MITVIVPRKEKKVPRLKKQDGTWVVLVRALFLYEDKYKRLAEQLQEHADYLNKKERIKQHLQNIEDSI